MIGPQWFYAVAETFVSGSRMTRAFDSLSRDQKQERKTTVLHEWDVGHGYLGLVEWAVRKLRVVGKLANLPMNHEFDIGYGARKDSHQSLRPELLSAVLGRTLGMNSR